MNRRHGARPSICQEDWHAVGSAYAYSGAHSASYQRVALTHPSLAALSPQADVRMNLFEGGDGLLLIPPGGEPGAEPVLQPGKVKPGYGAVYMLRVLAKMPRHGDYAAGFLVWATMIRCLKSSSIDSSKRTSVGRLVSVVMLPILSCSFISP